MRRERDLEGQFESLAGEWLSEIGETRDERRCLPDRAGGNEAAATRACGAANEDAQGWSCDAHVSEAHDRSQPFVDAARVRKSEPPTDAGARSPSEPS